MPSCEHPQGEAYCTNHGPAWIERTREQLDEITRIVDWKPYETLPEAVQRALTDARPDQAEMRAAGVRWLRDQQNARRGQVAALATVEAEGIIFSLIDALVDVMAPLAPEPEVETGEDLKLQRWVMRETLIREFDRFIAAGNRITPQDLADVVMRVLED